MPEFRAPWLTQLVRFDQTLQPTFPRRAGSRRRLPATATDPVGALSRPGRRSREPRRRVPPRGIAVTVGLRGRCPAQDRSRSMTEKVSMSHTGQVGHQARARGSCDTTLSRSAPSRVRSIPGAVRSMAIAASASAKRRNGTGVASPAGAPVLVTTTVSSWLDPGLISPPSVRSHPLAISRAAA